jgi:hypothetical protein
MKEENISFDFIKNIFSISNSNKEEIKETLFNKKRYDKRFIITPQSIFNYLIL